MRVGVEERLLCALPVYVNEHRPELPQQRNGRQTIVDEHAATPFGRKLASNNKFNVAAPARRNTRFFEQSFDLRVSAQCEQSFYRSTTFASAYKFRREAVADEHAERVN